METQITPNTFCTYTGLPSETEISIFFISGNPGLISYYHLFLSLLAQNLATTEGPKGPTKAVPCQIYGCSLSGFEVENDQSPVRSSLQSKKHDSQNGSRRAPEYYDLEDQIHFVHQKLADLMNVNSASNSEHASRRQKVVLIGHSVGAYIAMEILRRHREAAFGSNSAAKSEPSNSSKASADFDIVGGIMLFPTVIEIAASPSGRKLTVRGACPLSLIVLFAN